MGYLFASYPLVVLPLLNYGLRALALALPILDETCSIRRKIWVCIFGALSADALQKFIPFLSYRTLVFAHKTTFDMIKIVFSSVVLQHTLRHSQVISKPTCKHRPRLPRRLLKPIALPPRHLRPTLTQLSPISLPQPKPLGPILTHLPAKPTC